LCLVRRDEAPRGEPLFMMLETIREFALERLAAEASTTAAVVRPSSDLISPRRPNPN
jgi:hypothetical protein